MHAVIARPAGAATRRSTRGARCSPSAPGHVRRAGRRAAAQPRPQARAGCRFEEAACLPTAWLTAYRMLFTKRGRAARRHRARAGRRRRRGDGADRARRRGRPAGVGDQPRRGQAASGRVELGADEAFETGARLPERVDAVMETVGEATWAHSLKRSSRAARSSSPARPPATRRPAELHRIFFLQLRVVGSTMGTRDELDAAGPVLRRRRRAAADRPVLPLAEAREGFGAMGEGDSSARSSSPSEPGPAVWDRTRGSGQPATER